MQFNLAHRPFEAKQKPIIEAAWMVKPIAITNQRIDQGAQIEQVVPITIISCQTRDLEGQHNTNMAKTNLSDQPIEARPCDARSADAEIIVDDDHVVALPPEFNRTVAESVLPTLALQIGRDLLQRRLTHIDDRSP